MENIEKFEYFLNNEMDEDKERDFANSFAANKNFRSEFKDFILLKNVLINQKSSFVPSNKSKLAVFSAIGLSLPDENKIIAKENELNQLRKLIDNKFLRGLLIGILGTLLLFWGYDSFFSKGNEPKNPNPISKANNFPMDNSNELLAKNMVLDEKQPKGVQSNSKIRIVHDTIFKEKIIEIYKHNNPISKNQNEIIDDIDSAKITYQDNSNVFIDKSVKNYYLKEDNNIKLNSNYSDSAKLISSLAVPTLNDANIYKNDIQKNQIDLYHSFFSWLHNYQVELKRYNDFYSEPARSEPSYKSDFEKFGLTIHYLFNEKFSAGLDIRQETFNIKYRNEAEKETIYQQLNLTTLSAEFRYNYFLVDNYWSLNGSLALGANIIGYNLRPTFGTNLYLSDYFYLNFNANYNFLYFRQYGSFHPADKYSIYYGIGVKL